MHSYNITTTNASEFAFFISISIGTCKEESHL
jgi:hypothetical protein